MRILYLNPVGALGGAERSLLDIVAALRVLEPAWEFHVIAGASGPLTCEAERLGIKAEVLPLPDEWIVLDDSMARGAGGKIGVAFGRALRLARAGIGAKNYAGKLRARIGEIRPDIIHSNGMKFHLLTRMLGRVAAPVVWHIRDFPSTRRAIRHALRWAAPAAGVGIAQKEALAADARAILKIVPLRVVLNCVDTELFSPGPGRGEMLDELAGLSRAPEGTLRVGLLASYARWKGQDLLLNAVALVARNAPDLSVRFYIVGGPIYKTQGSQFSIEELRALAATLNLTERVGFVPFQNEPRDVYRALDVVVHASTQPEPFGRTIAEAMACGRPVIAALAGGVPELFQNDIEALGVPPNDAPALAAKIEALLRSRETRENLGAAARGAALERFSRARVGLQLRAIYGEMVK